MKFQQYLTEAFDKPYLWRSMSPSGGFKDMARFATDDGVEYLMFSKQTEKPKSQQGETDPMLSFLNDFEPVGGVWEFHFSMFKGNKGIVDRTGTGDEFRVFATVVDWIISVIKNRGPDEVHIMAKKEDPKRLKLYSRMVERYARKYGYKFLKQTDETQDRVGLVYVKK